MPVQERNSSNTLLMAIGLPLIGLWLYNQVNAQGRRKAANTANALRLKIVGINMIQNDITVNVQVLNPTSTDISIQSFVGEMYANSQVVADIQMFGDYTAKANNMIQIPLVARPRFKNLWQQMQMLFQRGNSRVTFMGTMNVNNQALPLTISYGK